MATTQLNPSTRVRKIAQVIRLFTPEERSQLLELVPELQNAEAEVALREPAVRYFTDELSALRDGRSLSLDAPFFGGLTYGAYLSLSEKEEQVFWDNVFAEDVMDIDDYEERHVKRNARVSAR